MKSEKAIKALQSVVDALDEIDHSSKQLAEQLSYHDKRKEDILHRIEQMNFNAADGYKVAKELKGALAERRAVKNEMATLCCFKDSLGSQGLSKKKLTDTISRMKKAGWNR